MGLIIFLTWLCLLLTLYVYVGYPIIMGVWAWFAPKSVDRAEIRPTVSLIIAAYNEDAVIGEKIENSFKLDYPADKLEIMVVADGSSDNTPKIAERYADKGVVVLFSPERRGKSAALNRGVQQATGEILVFSDANAYYNEDALKKIVRNFNDAAVGGVSGKKTVRASATSATESEGLYWKYESFIKKAETKTGSTAGVVGEMNAIRKALYEDIPENIINDDFYLALMAMGKGYRVLYEQEAISWELPSLALEDDIVRRRRMTAGRYQQMFMFHLWINTGLVNVFRLVSHKFLRLLLPFFMFGALLFNLIAVVFPPRPLLLIVILVIQFVAYDLALFGYILERQGRKSKIPSAAYYVVSSNIASFRGLMRYLRKEQSVLWDKARRSTS